jgi:hypothetical protein
MIFKDMIFSSLLQKPPPAGFLPAFPLRLKSVVGLLDTLAEIARNHFVAGRAMLLRIARSAARNGEDNRRQD